MNSKIEWPEGKKFAFTVFDDTDLATLENVKPVYDLLAHCGFRTTKSVWPLKGERQPLVGGMTCADQDYLNWILELQRAGFEIGYHNATYHTSTREETIRGINRFKELFGHDPYTMANHVGCDEAIYWGNARLTGVNEKVYNIFTRGRWKNKFRGHVVSDELFWGDICRGKIKYVRNFVFPEINTMKIFPYMPYFDQQRPLVNYWFGSSGGATVTNFNKCIDEKNQDRLEEKGGACIMYTHFACGFYENQNINKRFGILMERLSRKNGWFVPVVVLLDYLLKTNGCHAISGEERSRLERKWLLYKIRVGTN